MRYFIVKYYKKPNGQTDEEVSVVTRIRQRDLQTAAVILDFKTQVVIMASVNGTTIPKDWQRIRDYYHQHYKSIIEDLENSHVIKV